MTPRHLLASNLHSDTGATAQYYDRPASAGTTRHSETNWHITVGNLVHECCAAHADLRHLPPHELAQSVLDWATAHARSTKVLGNLPKARAAVASNANVYLTRYAPGTEAQFLGAEIPVEGGRIDLAWFIPDLGIVVDELKTVRQVHMHADNPGVAQCHRYVDAGRTEWGDLFAGVRYLPLSLPSQAMFFTPDHGEHTLDRYTPADIIRKAA